MFARSSQETAFIEHDVWSRWAHRQVNLTTRLKDLPFRPFETLLKNTNSLPAQLSLSMPNQHLDLVGIRTSTGWSRQYHSADTSLIPYHPRKKNSWAFPQYDLFNRQSFGLNISGTFDCMAVVLLQTRGVGTRFAVFLEAYETHWLLKPFKGPIRMSVCFRPDLSTFQQVDCALQNNSQSHISIWGALTQDDLDISFSSFSSSVTSLPTVSVGIKVSQPSNWVACVRIISYVLGLLTAFVMEILFPSLFSLLVVSKLPTAIDKEPVFPSSLDPYIPAAIPILFWITALHQDMPVVAHFVPGTAHFIRQNRKWLAIIIAIVGCKATLSFPVFNVMSAFTTVRLALHYHKHPNREVWKYHCELITSLLFIVVWVVLLSIEITYPPLLLKSNKSILGFISSYLLFGTHTLSLCFYYFTFSL